MISTNQNLPHSALRTPHFVDEASGLANLNARQQRQLRFIDAGVTLAIGLVLGALIVTAVFLAAL